MTSGQYLSIERSQQGLSIIVFAGPIVAAFFRVESRSSGGWR
jgi:hypothetical protein